MHASAQHLTSYIACVSLSECASLTVTLVVTLRKFMSLLFSIWFFQVGPLLFNSTAVSMLYVYYRPVLDCTSEIELCTGNVKITL